MELNGRFAADGLLAWLGVDKDGILIFSGSSLPNWKGRRDALLHLDGGGGLLGPAVSVVATGTAKSGSHSKSRPKTSGPQDAWRQDSQRQKGRVGEGHRLLLGFRA